MSTPSASSTGERERANGPSKSPAQFSGKQTSQGPTDVLRDHIRWAMDLARDPRQSWWVCALVLLGDVVLTAVVVKKVNYTEIDWKAYMQQIETFLSGERNYAKIRGDTGPLVYPAAHVYIYLALHRLTSSGTDIFTAQLIFAALYLVTLAVVMACYRRAGVAPWVYPLLALSKRLHSVYVLRLFNDPWAVLFFWISVWCAQRKRWGLAIAAFSVGLGVKMSLLLVLPGWAVLLYLAQGPWGAVASALAMLRYQVLLGLPFLIKFPREYLGKAFEFSRVFMFKWTVNWRFVGEQGFLSKKFATGLLLAHALLLSGFGLSRWLKQGDLGLTEVVRSFVTAPPFAVQRGRAAKVTPDFVLSTLLGANAIGMLCARSLHYQFYSWIAWATPYLLWRSGLHPAAVVLIWAAQEIAWNIYPSTSLSSAVVVACLAAQVGGLWFGTASEKASPGSKVHSHQE